MALGPTLQGGMSTGQVGPAEYHDRPIDPLGVYCDHV